MNNFLKLGTALAIAAGASTTAYAQLKPEDGIRARQSIMRVVAINFGPVAQMAQDKIPYNKDVFVANAVRLESVWAMNPARFFVSGSDKPVAGAKIAGFTDAKVKSGRSRTSSRRPSTGIPRRSASWRPPRVRGMRMR